MGQVAQVAQHAPVAVPAILARIIGRIAGMRADEGEDAVENLCWENRDELTRSHTWGEVRLPADTNRAAQSFRRACQLLLLLVLPPKGEPHGDDDDGMAVAKRRLD